MKFGGIALIVVLYVILPVAQTAVYLAGLPFADAADVLNFSASIVAYHWLLANVILGLKLPLLQTSLPYDLRIRLHVATTLGLVVLLAWHSIVTLFVKVQLIDPVSWALMVLFGTLLFLSVLWIPLPGLKRVRSRLVGLIHFGWFKSYDWLKTSHKILFFVLAALTYVHVVQSEILGLVPPLSGLGYQLLFVVAAGLFLGTRIHNLTLPTLKVQSVAVEGGLVRLSLSGHPRLRYRSGQFAFLRFQPPGLKGEEHPFSFTTAAHEPRVGFAIRALGDFTAKLASLVPGDRVKINGGFGAFRPAAGTEPLALIASGIGAAPILSILKELARREPQREVVCLLSVNRREELVEPEAWRSLEQSLPQLRLKIFVHEEDGQLYGTELFARELGNASRYRFYLCSSDKVRLLVVRALRGLGVKPRKIHFEAFNLG